MEVAKNKCKLKLLATEKQNLLKPDLEKEMIKLETESWQDKCLDI